MQAMIWANAGGVLLSLSMMSFWPVSPLLLWAGALLFGLSVASMFPSILNFAKQAPDCKTLSGATGITVLIQAWIFRLVDGWR